MTAESTKEVLDQGYVRLIEHWGTEERIIESARMSTGKGFVEWSSDEKLLRFLYSHKHLTPFEMVGMTIEVKAPIMVFREWHRHRTQSYNEMSARYIPLPNDNYLPFLSDLHARAEAAANSSNKQARAASSSLVDYGAMAGWLASLSRYYEEGQKLYDEGLRIGVPKELARLPTTVGRYSRMRASANLRNWLQFLELRLAPNAQKEIRLYAEAVASIASVCFPRTINLFIEAKEKKS